MGRPTAVRSSPAGRRVPVKLALISGAFAERANPTWGPELVFHHDTFHGRAVLLRALPRPGAFALSVSDRRLRIRIRRVRRVNRLAADGERRGVGPAGAPVPVARGSRPVSARERRFFRRIPRNRLAQRPPPNPHLSDASDGLPMAVLLFRRQTPELENSAAGGPMLRRHVSGERGSNHPHL